MKEIQSADKRDIFAAMQGVIGLEEPKHTLRKIIAFHRLQEEAKTRGIEIKSCRYNMCFVGNPGTAKTTFARACARTFQHEGITAQNAFIEAGRGDLIASYVGQTAPKVRRLFNRASGGVLFIDEAYSIIENTQDGYGCEAVATLVQEMENHKDVIVILAGYPDKMAEFLSWNPGLRSRIPFTLHFPNYTCEELVKISECIASRDGFRIDPNAEEKIHSIIMHDIDKADFGNARYVRNLVESAQMNRASRLVFDEGLSELPNSELFVLTAEDFQRPGNTGNGSAAGRPIGFSI